MVVRLQPELGGKNVVELATSLLKGPLPDIAVNDAFHVAMAALTGIECFLAWNCRHIFNPALRCDITEVCRLADCECPVISSHFLLNGLKR